MSRVSVRPCCRMCYLPVFFLNYTATTEIYTLSLHDALPIFFRGGNGRCLRPGKGNSPALGCHHRRSDDIQKRSEEHTSELQSQSNLVCRLLLEKKNKPQTTLRAHILSGEQSNSSAADRLYRT